MPASTESVSGLSYGWALGESGWNQLMDANLLKLGAIVQIGVLDRTLTTPPATPAAGERHIVGAAATGAWAGKDGKLAVWRSSLSAWEFYAPAAGWLAYIVAEAKLAAYTGSAWSAGVAL